MAEEFKMIPVPKELQSQLTSPVYTVPAVSWPSANGGDSFRRQHILQIVQKHWLFSVLFATTFVAALMVVTMSMRNTYEAVARIEIEPPPTPTSLSLSGTSNADGDQQDYMQTQIEILKSDALAASVIEKLHLGQNSDFISKPKQHRWFVAQNSVENLSNEDAMDVALNSLRSQLTVEEVRNSRLVEVRFSNHSAEVAAQVTNELVNLYLERTYRAQYESVMKAAKSVSPEMEQLRQGVEKANQAVVDFINSTGIVELTSAESGQPGTNSGQTPVAQRVAELNRQLTEAQTDRIQLEAYLQMIQAGSGDSLPQMRDNPVLQDITKRYGESRAQLAQALAVYGQNNTNAKKLQNQVDELGQQVTEERRRIIEQVKTSFQAALAHEQLLAQAVAGIQSNVAAMNKNLFQYDELKKRAQANSELYNAISSRLEEAALAGSLNSNNIRVVDSARPPRMPAKPNRPEIIFLGIVFSVFGAVALAFVKEFFDDNVYTPEDIRAWTALPSLAMFPTIASPKAPSTLISSSTSPGQLIPHNDKNGRNRPRSKFFLERPGSEEAEAVRSLVTSIRIPGGPGAEAIRVILLVSPFPGEGKTTIAVNLAMALAQHGKTCLVDADLRNPVVGRTFDLSLQQGLSDVLRGSLPLDGVLKPSDLRVANLTILPAGPRPQNPGELVSSRRMRDVLGELRQRFDHVVIDSPPMIPYADARSLSATADGIVLVARSGVTKQRALARASEMLASFQAPVLGVVLNGVDIKSGYYYGYGSYGNADN